MNELESKINSYLDSQVLVLSTNQVAKIIGISKSGICIEMLDDQKRYTYTNGPRPDSNPFTDGFLQFVNPEEQEDFLSLYSLYSKRDENLIFGLFFF